MSCHTSQHTKAYLNSPHHELWKKEISGEAAPGSGVSCATCHMPVLEHENDYGDAAYYITHNQNDTLRPNEKMIRPVCMNCHGLQFTLNALADKKLIEKNFAGQPSVHVQSIDWVLKRATARAAKRAAEKALREKKAQQ